MRHGPRIEPGPWLAGAVMIVLCACSDMDFMTDPEEGVRIVADREPYALGDTGAIRVHSQFSRTIVADFCSMWSERRTDDGWEFVASRLGPGLACPAWFSPGHHADVRSGWFHVQTVLVSDPLFDVPGVYQLVVPISDTRPLTEFLGLPIPSEPFTVTGTATTGPGSWSSEGSPGSERVRSGPSASRFDLRRFKARSWASSDAGPRARG